MRATSWKLMSQLSARSVAVAQSEAACLKGGFCTKSAGEDASHLMMACLSAALISSAAQSRMILQCVFLLSSTAAPALCPEGYSTMMIHSVVHQLSCNSSAPDPSKPSPDHMDSCASSASCSHAIDFESFHKTPDHESTLMAGILDRFAADCC